MSKQGDADHILRRIDERGRVDHSAATSHSVRVWRIERAGALIAWLRYSPVADDGYIREMPWHLYFDAIDAEGRRVWCRSFASSSSACAWAMQHAGELRARARRGRA